MAEPDELCPTCHSFVSPNATSVDRKKQGEVESGETVIITDENGGTREVRTSTSGAKPQWTDDPGLTLRGFNGDNFIGRDAIRNIHIKEIQDARRAEEEEAGLAESDKTKFSNIDEDTHIRNTHITELRESTEKLLDASGSTLADYFKLDPDEVEQDPGPNDEADKEDWTDVERGADYINRDGQVVSTFVLPSGLEELSPTFPDGTHIRLIHIEDLRHPLHLGWREFWSVSEPTLVSTPGDYTTRRLQETTYTQGTVVNFPTLIPSGFDRFEEFLLSALPEGAGTRVIDNASANVSDTVITVEATEQGLKGFPSGFDIHPSDGGNKYLFDFIDIDNAEPAYGTKEIDEESDEATYTVDKTWIIEAFGVDRTGSREGAVLYSGGVNCPFEHEVEGSATADAKGTGKAEILDQHDELVEAINVNAKTLRLSVRAITEHEKSGVNVTIAPPADCWVNASHIWFFEQADDANFGYPISLLSPEPPPTGFDTWESQKQDDLHAIGNRNINIRFNTHLKFFVHFVLNGDTDKFGLTSFDHPNIETYNARVRSYETAELTANNPINSTRGTLVWGNTRDTLPSIFGSIADVDGGFTTAKIKQVYGIMLLMFKIQSSTNPMIFKVIFSDPPPGGTDFTTEKSGAFNGQTFKFVTPPSNNNGKLATVYLGEKDKYDEAINLDDLLFAWRSVPSSGFSYTSNKKLDDDNNIIQNPGGTQASLLMCRFYLGAKVVPEVTEGTVEGSGTPDCTIEVTSGSVQNFTADAFMDITALRIQGNDKKLEDLQSE